MLWFIWNRLKGIHQLEIYCTRRTGERENRTPTPQLGVMYTGLLTWARPYRTHMGLIRKSPYGQAHNGPGWDHDSKPIWTHCGMYTIHMGPIRSSPYGHSHKGPMWGPDSKPLWAQCGMYTGLPVWARQYRIHVGQIRSSPYGQSHKDPCGAQVASQYGLSVGCIRA